ncbi:hypothetical protein L3Y34_016472 [Caenorhabditis briggsae]|uniref:Uncharacterized protein n=1 Tax=Caenorhabditis briggsae TaxID=6238 RepID=A0AAE9DXQ3_CAEBR|nr:hypothetical protein L3Y34_016472 [Caenorhabditis briggsae]
MYFENDEGIDSNSSHRDYPTFMPDETSMIFPQKLDLSTLNSRKTPKKKKISPIKANAPQKSLNLSEISRISHKKHNETVDLQEMRNSFNEIMAKSQRKLSDSSVTSDRASSVCSTSSGQSQKSLFVQVTRAKKLVDQREETQREQRKSTREIWEDSDWCIGTTDTDNDDTRPPSSQPSLAFESGAIEQHRLATGSSELMDDSIQKTSKKRTQKTSVSSRSQKVNTATNTTRVHLSDTQLYDLYDQRRQKNARNLNSEDPDDDDNDVTLTDNGPDIVESAFQGYYAEQSKKETPILSGFDSAHFAPIEKARNANRSASLNNIMMTSSPTTVPRNTVFDGFAPGALRHSISTIQVSPQKLRELEQQNKTHPIPSLAQFRIPKSTRTIFPLPLMDIDEISGKGVRKDNKSTQRHFSGQAISAQIHGPPATSRSYSNPTVPQEGRAARPTTASQAKKVDFQLGNLNLAPKNSNLNSKNSNSRRPPVPYCSATSSDGTAYSIHTVTQQLLGTVKSLHPDWLQMTRRLLAGNSDDVASEFRRLLILEKENLETKWRQNRNDHPFEEDPIQRITVIRRALEKLENLGHLSRIQQLKVIHSALLST